VPKINFQIPHELSAQDAQGRLQRFSEHLESKFGDQVKDLEQSWSDKELSFGFKTYGIRIDGKITVESESVNVDADLPFSAMMFKGKIESEIRQQLERILKA